MKKDTFLNKNVVITGGSSGIGLALAKKLAENGAKCWLIARNEEKLINSLNSLPTSAQGGYFALDVSNIEQVQQLGQDWDKNIHIDYIFNSAGVAHPGEFVKTDLEIFHYMMDINFFGTVNIIKILMPYLSPHAHIVNISSMAAVLGVYGYTAYGASKYAVRGFTDILRSELKLDGKAVSLVFPPDTQTPQLDYENKIKPPITKEIAGNSGILSAEAVTQEILNGVSKKKYIILPGFESKLIYSGSNLLGRLIYPVMDWMVRSAEKKHPRQP